MLRVMIELDRFGSQVHPKCLYALEITNNGTHPNAESFGNYEVWLFDGKGEGIAETVIWNWPRERPAWQLVGEVLKLLEEGAPVKILEVAAPDRNERLE